MISLFIVGRNSISKTIAHDINILHTTLNGGYNVYPVEEAKDD